MNIIEDLELDLREAGSFVTSELGDRFGNINSGGANG